MKIVISTQTNSAEGPFDPRFGRAAYFCIYDTETESWQAHDNQAIQATGGAGVQASQFIAQKGAQVAISGDFGPNAYMTLSAAGIQMFLVPAGVLFFRKGFRQDFSPAGRILILSWFLPGFLFLMMSSQKREVYLLPVLAPVSLAVAAWI